MLKLIIVKTIRIPFRAWVSKDDRNDSRYMGFCFDIPVFVRADTMEQVIEDLKEAILAHVQKESDDTALSV
jgi:predicted RNase H-like HicB family nuclease